MFRACGPWLNWFLKLLKIVQVYLCPQMMFPDGSPVMIISEASLEDLNQKYGIEELGMDRFRPNIVVTGCVPFAEVKKIHFEVCDENNNMMDDMILKY